MGDNEKTEKPYEPGYDDKPVDKDGKRIEPGPKGDKLPEPPAPPAEQPA